MEDMLDKRPSSPTVAEKKFLSLWHLLAYNLLRSLGQRCKRSVRN
jgi:hypothetical protein